MERDSSHISNLQPHILEYVTGILWILALLASLPGSGDVAGFIGGVATVLKPLMDLKMPDLVTGFLVAIGGVVVPYALAMAFRPLTLWLMNRLLRVTRLVNLRLMKRERRDLYHSAMKHLQVVLGISSEVDSPEQLAYVGFHNESVAAMLEWSLNDVIFRAASTLPSAIMFAAIAYRFTPASLFTASVVGIVIFGLSAAHSIQMLNRWQDRAESLTILYATAKTP